MRDAAWGNAPLPLAADGQAGAQFETVRQRWDGAEARAKGCNVYSGLARGSRCHQHWGREGMRELAEGDI